MISVVMPTYNRQAYLAEAVNSILKQSYKDLELIVINDGGTDDTDLLMDYFMKNDPRVRYYKLPRNYGIAYARNFGNQLANGEYIAVADSDDLSSPDRFKKEIKAIKDVDFVASGYFLGDNHAKIGNMHIPAKKVTLDGIRRNDNWPHLTILARKECFLENPYRVDFKVNDDGGLMWDWFKAGYKYKIIGQPLAIQRATPGNTSRTKKKEIADTQAILDKEYDEYEALQR